MAFYWSKHYKHVRKTNIRACRHRFSSLIRGSLKETIHKHYRAAESEECDTVELCNACLSMQQVSAYIDAFPSAIVLQKQKPEDRSMKKKTQQPNTSPPLTTSDRHTGSWTEHLTEAEKRCLDSISCLDPLNYRASWNVLSPCCPGCAIFIPVQPLCSSTCHLHSEFPAADLLTAPEREGSHNTSSKEEVYLYCSCCYVPLLMVLSILVQLKLTFVGTNHSPSYSGAQYNQSIKVQA